MQPLLCHYGFNSVWYSPKVSENIKIHQQKITLIEHLLLLQASMSKQAYDDITGGVHMVGEGVDQGQAVLAEMLATTILVLAVLMVAFDGRNKSILAPLAIGLAVGGGIFAM